MEFAIDIHFDVMMIPRAHTWTAARLTARKGSSALNGCFREDRPRSVQKFERSLQQ